MLMCIKNAHKRPAFLFVDRYLHTVVIHAEVFMNRSILLSE